MTRDKEAARLFWLRFDDILKKKDYQLRDIAVKSCIPYGSLAGWRAKHLFPDVEAVMGLASTVSSSVDALLGIQERETDPRIQVIVDILRSDPKKISALETLWDIDEKKAGSSGTKAG